MSCQIRVRIHGQDYGVLELQEGMEYFAGRGSQSHIVLQNERGISRQHIKIFFDDNIWTVQLLSKFGGLVYEGDEVELIQLQNGTSFSIDPYEFIYEENLAEGDALDSTQAIYQEEPQNSVDEGVPLDDDDSDYSQVKKEAITPQGEQIFDEIPVYEESDSGQDDLSNDDSEGPDFGEPEPTNFSEVDENQMSHDEFDDKENTDEMTMIGGSNLAAHLRISTNRDEPEELLKLDGELWTAGRSPSCEIYINNKNISRKHFDISKRGEKYYITDHGSSNGTNINDEPVIPKEPTPLYSGDIIKIKAVEIVFEVRDSQFDNKLAVLPTPQPQMQDMELDYDGGYNGPAVLKVEGSKHSGGGGGKKPNKMVIIIAVVLLLTAALFYDSGPKSDSGEITQTSGDSGQKQLTEEQQREIKSLYDIAKNQYMTGKFELCVSRLQKLHTIVPSYNDSKEVESLCNQAIDIVDEEEARRRLEDLKKANEQKIANITTKCKKKLDVIRTIDDMRTCLQDAIEIDPENILINDVLTIVQARIEEENINKQKQADANRACANGNRQYSKAKNAEASGQLKKAISEYSKFVNSSYPCLKSEQASAKNKISALKADLKRKVKAMTAKCDSLFQEKNYNEALKTCLAAKKEDPTDRSIASTIKDIQGKACREAKVMYEDAILEESMGNLEAAIQKWQDIQKMGIKKCEQFGRSKRKLRKYGN